MEKPFLLANESALPIGVIIDEEPMYPLFGVPQLGTTAAIAGSAMSYAVRKIANSEPFPLGRYFVGLLTFHNLYLLT